MGEGSLPPLLPPLSDAQAPAAARRVFDDIKATRGTDVVNDFWRVLAHDPALLQRTWDTLKATMGLGTLDPLVKELIYIAVSVTNGCTYCIHSHTASARQKGMTDQMMMELAAVVGMANETNRLVTALQVPVDAAFIAPQPAAAAAYADPGAPAAQGEPAQSEPAAGEAAQGEARSTAHARPAKAPAKGAASRRRQDRAAPKA